MQTSLTMNATELTPVCVNAFRAASAWSLLRSLMKAFMSLLTRLESTRLCTYICSTEVPRTAADNLLASHTHRISAPGSWQPGKYILPGWYCQQRRQCGDNRVLHRRPPFLLTLKPPPPPPPLQTRTGLAWTYMYRLLSGSTHVKLSWGACL